MKTFINIIAVISAVLMLFGLAAVGLNAVFNHTGWLYKEYRSELDIENEVGISAEDASRVLTCMMRYSTGRSDELDCTIEEDGEEVPFFNERELSHMRDVRKLTRSILWAGAISLALSATAVALLFVFKKHSALRVFAKAYLIALGVAALIIIALAVWVVVDFDSFWTMFHVVFLDLESSTFDPAASRMIRICPPELFADFVGRLGSYAAILVGGAGIICFLCLRGRKNRKAA